jgi:serine/threonine-protein kinase RsbW
MDCSRHTLRISSDHAGARKARRWLAEALSRGGHSRDFIAESVLATGEVLTNVIRHGYGNRPDQPIDVRLDLEPERVLIVVSDVAAPFRPRAGVPPEPQVLAEGGYGLHVVHRLMDEVHYETDARGNHFSMMKKSGRSTSRAAS